ncbi:PLP-dependent aminotransferase family protein [Vibrio mimicus]
MIKPPSSFIYRILEDKLVQLIKDGVFKPGDRLPSLRQFSRQERVSVTTAIQTYGLLESRGYIQAKPQSGYFVRERNTQPPAEPSVSTLGGTVARGSVGNIINSVLQSSLNTDIAPFGAATPGPELIPQRMLDRLLMAEIRRHDHRQGNSYPPGEYGLRRQIARRSMDWGGQLDPEEIVVTTGGTQAIDLCIRAVTKPGDLVAVESPCYFGTLLLLKTLGLSVLEIPSHPRDGLCLGALREALAAHPVRACIASPCFSNPLGSCMSDAAKQELVEMLAMRTIPLIEDDIYGDLCHTEPRPRPAKVFDSQGLVMLCSSFSKILAPEYRIGWTVPGRFREQVEWLQMASVLAVPKIFQGTIASFLESGAYDRHLRKLRISLASQAARMIETIEAYFPSGTKVIRPRGGLVLWLELPANSDAMHLSESALANGISICPGPIFSTTQQYRSYIRLNFGYPWSPCLEQATLKLGKLLQSEQLTHN